MSLRRLLLLTTIATIALSTVLTFKATAQQVSCPGALPTRLSAGGSGKLSFTQTGSDPTPVRVREVPGKAGRVMGQLRGNVVFRVLSGPQCKDNIAWWQVVGQNVVGWIAEGDNTGYFVEPTGTAAPTDSGGPSDPNNPNNGPSDATPIILATPTLSPILAQSSPANFAQFSPGPVETVGSLAPYQIATDFSNVVLSVPLSASQLDYLQRNTFVVSPGTAPEFYVVYKQAQRNNEPLFITSDSLLHSFHLAFDKTLRTAESRYFLPLLRDLNKSLLAEADKNYQLLRGTGWEDAALRTVAYVGVSTRLADPAALVPDYASGLVTSEVSNISSAAGVGASAIFTQLLSGEDWTQYQPRGHYTQNEALQSYFRAMMYYGRMTFRLSQPEETKSALLLVAALRTANVSGKPGLTAWSDLYESTGFFAGRSNNLTIHQYGQIMDSVYGLGGDVKTLESRGVDPFLAVAKTLPAPKIVASLISSDVSVDADTKGLKFMGQRFVWDAYAFSQLIYDRVGTAKKPRGLPSALDIFAVLGSDRALQILDKDGTTSYENYTTQMGKLRDQIGTLDESAWTSSLYDAWLYTVNTLNQPAASGSPIFMANQPYADRMLYTSLGSYAELKHDTVLYAQQASSSAGAGAPSHKSAPPAAAPPPNYVEPVPLFWARLAALAEMANTGLGSRKLISSADAEMLRAIADVARRFQAYSIAELKNEALSPDDQAFLSGYGSILEGIVTAAADKSDGQDGLSGAFSLPTPPFAGLVTDIATDYSAGRVQHVATGTISNLYVAVPVNGKVYLTHGGSYSFYEFSLKGRMTDDAWQQTLTGNSDSKVPALPAWTYSFLTQETVPAAMGEAVRSLQKNLLESLWYSPVSRYTQLRESADKRERYIAAQLEPLARAHQYEARQLLEMSFVSVQIAAGGKTATMITHETWQGELHNNGIDEDSDGPKIGVRGPYSLEMTYSLEKGTDDSWTITEVNTNGDVPAWTDSVQ